MKRIAAALTFTGLALSAATAMAQMNRFDFGQAQQMIDQTIGHIEGVRRAGHDQFDGHAAKAEELLRQAKAELKAAGEYRPRY